MAKTTAGGSTAEHQPPYQPDEIDQQLLNEMQSDFPLLLRPYAALAERVGISEDDALTRVQRLKDEQILRQISAILDSRRLGYSTSLVAMEFPDDELEAGAAVVSLHPGVSHNYKRNHRFNLWFTIAVPPHKDLDEEVAALASKARPTKTWLLPTIQLFKIGVNLDMSQDADATATESADESIGLRSAKRWSRDILRPTFTNEELTAIRVSQQDLPVVAEPFAQLVDGTGLSAARLLELLQQFLDSQQMRRYAAVLRHRRAGYRANAMAVWVVPEEQMAEVGPQMASFKAVSHCYERPTYPDWPYSVFTMIHGRHADDCEAVAQAIAEATGIDDYAMLYSTKEYKKTRVRYFLDDDAFDVEQIPVRGTA